MSKTDSRLIVALDHADLDQALALVDVIDELVDFYKVGLTLYTAAGPAAIRELKGRGKRVFLDLKLHDIPVQVAGASASAASLGVELLTVHVAGGEAMMRAAAGAVEGRGVRLLGVTVLTSLPAPDGAPLAAAQAAMAAGLDGVVAAPSEAAAIRRALGSEPLIVTPGIRLRPVSQDDQARTGDPASALTAGASHLVVGRPITAESDPRGAAAVILAAMRG